VTVELRRYRGMIHGSFQMTGALEGPRRLHCELGDWKRRAAVQAQRVTGDELADRRRNPGVTAAEVGVRW